MVYGERRRRNSWSRTSQGRGSRTRESPEVHARSGAWSELLVRAVWEYLGESSAMADRTEGSAAAEIDRLVSAWQALLRLHDPDSVRCGCRRSRLSRSARLCDVWQIAFAYFVRAR